MPTTKQTHAPYALLWGAVVLVYGKITKTACGKRIASKLLVARGSQSCAACQAAIDAERAEYAELEAAAHKLTPDYDWVDELVAGAPEYAPNPHYFCRSQDTRPCPTGEHQNPYPLTKEGK